MMFVSFFHSAGLNYRYCMCTNTAYDKAYSEFWCTDIHKIQKFDGVKFDMPKDLQQRSNKNLAFSLASMKCNLMDQYIIIVYTKGLSHTFPKDWLPFKPSSIPHFPDSDWRKLRRQEMKKKVLPHSWECQWLLLSSVGRPAAFLTLSGSESCPLGEWVLKLTLTVLTSSWSSDISLFRDLINAVYWI